MFDLNTIRFCARECELQGSGEMSVAWMLNAWDYAIKISGEGSGAEEYLPTFTDVLKLGSLVEPRKNATGFRTTPVSIGHDLLDNQRVIPHQINSLMSNLDAFTPEDFFKEFETIHPFVDGNGRTGQILFNWLGGTLSIPQFAPNFWSDPRRM